MKYCDSEFETWIRNNYSYYWIRKSREYGLDNYCKGLIGLILKARPGCAFELGIGTGYPFAGTLNSSGIDVQGCDI